MISVQKRGEITGNVHFGLVDRVIQSSPNVSAFQGKNYFGLAMEILATMMATGFNSGSVGGQRLYLGESLKYGGKVFIEKDHKIYTVFFSGIDEAEDVKIADLGMYMLMGRKTD